MLYLVTVNYFSHELIGCLLRSLVSTLPFHWVIVNNSPEDCEIYQFANSSITILEAGENLGFGGGCNLGIDWVYQQNPQSLIWLINPDTEMPPSTMPTAMQFLTDHPEISILGTVVKEPNQKTWSAGGKFIPDRGDIIEHKTWDFADNIDYVLCDWVSGCSLLINLKKFDRCPKFDRVFFLYYEDFDFCQRYKQEGHQVAVTNKFTVIHHPSTISERNLYLKYKHSTYSYLLCLERYSSKNFIFLWLKWLKLVINSIFLLLLKPDLARGKIAGIWEYLQSRNV